MEIFTETIRIYLPVSFIIMAIMVHQGSSFFLVWLVECVRLMIRLRNRFLNGLIEKFSMKTIKSGFYFGPFIPLGEGIVTNNESDAYNVPDVSRFLIDRFLRLFIDWKFGHMS